MLLCRLQALCGYQVDIKFKHTLRHFCYVVAYRTPAQFKHTLLQVWCFVASRPSAGTKWASDLSMVYCAFATLRLLVRSWPFLGWFWVLLGQVLAALRPFFAASWIDPGRSWLLLDHLGRFGPVLGRSLDDIRLFCDPSWRQKRWFLICCYKCAWKIMLLNIMAILVLEF